MATSAPAALEDLRSFVLGDHALDLEQQVLLGVSADGAIGEHDLGADAAELLDEKNPDQAWRRARRSGART